MGFPLVCYCFVVPKPLVAFCQLLSAVREALLLMLAVVGLCRLPRDLAAGGGSGSRSGSGDGPRPEEVKERLPAVEYGQLVAEQRRPSSGTPCHGGGGGDGEEGDDAPATCIVCLEPLEAADEVRRLGGCAHAFHRGCIDRWIDLGRATCPLCRSDLLPRARGRAVLGRLAALLTGRAR